MLSRREYKELYLLHHQKAETGNAESQFKLGEYYEHGNGVVKDYRLAEFWYRKALESKHPMALLNLNWMRLKELGIEQNEGHLNLLIDCKPRGHRHEQHCRCMMRVFEKKVDVNDENDGYKPSLDFLRVSSPPPSYHRW